PETDHGHRIAVGHRVVFRRDGASEHGAHAESAKVLARDLLDSRILDVRAARNYDSGPSGAAHSVCGAKVGSGRIDVAQGLERDVREVARPAVVVTPGNRN